MSRNEYSQPIQELISAIPSLHTEDKDIICTDCGGISPAKVQQLLSTLENTREFLPRKRKISSRNNNQKKAIRRKKTIKTRKKNIPKRTIRSKSKKKTK